MGHRVCLVAAVWETQAWWRAGDPVLSLDRPAVFGGWTGRPGTTTSPMAQSRMWDRGLASCAALSQLRRMCPRSWSPSPSEPTVVPEPPADARPSNQRLNLLCREADSQVHR